MIKSALVFFLSVITLFASQPPPVQAENGMVASRSTIASEVGVAIMKQGGNAIDAAVATGFALAVTYPSAGNIGGGGFMVIHLANGESVALDFRETAPLTASRDMYLDEKGEVVKGLSTRSHKASGVPGSVDGLLTVLEKYGTKSRAEVLAPAIKLAREGFPLTHDLADQFENQLRFMKDYPASMAQFSKDGVPYKAGEIWRQPVLADTLTRIAENGRDGFYAGKTAELLAAEMKRGGGEVSPEDLKAYRSKWREPVKGTYRGHEILSMPPSSSGGVLVVNMLNMVENYDVKSMGWGGSELIHLMIEVERRAYADRAQYLGDTDFVDVPIKKLTAKSYAKKRLQDFSPEKAGLSSEIGHGTWPKESRETTHYSVVDKAGNAVACTTTLNWGYGSKIVVPGAGFLLNNEMDDFSIKPNTPNSYGLIGRSANEIQPGKRMLSSMTPTIVTKDGKVLLVTGSPGGSTIITTVFQVILNVIDHGMDVSEAVGAPRFHHQWEPDRVMYERYAFSPDTLKALSEMGHQGLTETSWEIGDANSIVIENGVLYGASDPRNDARAVGY